MKSLYLPPFIHHILPVMEGDNIVC